MHHDIRPVIQVSNLGHAMHIFVNDVYIGIIFRSLFDVLYSPYYRDMVCIQLF